jgi:histidine triad (HIT) family protein
MSSIFSKIAAGEIPSYKIGENKDFFAFLDINPLVRGHVLVVPKKETDYIFDIEESEYSELFLFARKIAIAIKKVIPCNKVGIAVVGLEVPHAHIHLIPIKQIKDMDFSNDKLQLSKNEFIAISDEISREFNKL